jgi:hypothetical protein
MQANLLEQMRSFSIGDIDFIYSNLLICSNRFFSIVLSSRDNDFLLMYELSRRFPTRINRWFLVFNSIHDWNWKLLKDVKTSSCKDWTKEHYQLSSWIDLISSGQESEREEEGKICDWFLLIKDYSEREKKNVLLLLWTNHWTREKKRRRDILSRYTLIYQTTMLFVLRLEINKMYCSL